MRSRLVLAFVTVSVTLVALFGIPRAFVLSDNVRENNQALVDHAADAAVVLSAQARQQGGTVTPTLLLPLLGDGERVQLRGGPDGGFTLPAGSELGADDLRATRELDGGGTLVYSLDGERVDDEVWRTLLPLLLLGLALIPVGVLVGSFLARRLARPFRELAAVARSLGAGDLQPEVRHYAVPEAEEIAAALRESSHRLHLMLERERDVAVNASHELRTPITALRLALEDVAQWPQTAPEVRAELDRLVGEVDRLAEAVTTLLDARRRWSVPAER